MADVAVAATVLSATAPTADLLTNAEGGTQVTASDIAVLTVDDDAASYVVVVYASGGAAVATVLAGDNPPAMRAGLGNVAHTVPASDTVAFVVEAARHLQDNGTIRIDIDTNTCQVSFLKIPRTV